MTHREVLKERGTIGLNTTYCLDSNSGTLHLHWRGKDLIYRKLNLKVGDYIYCIFDGSRPKIGKVRPPKNPIAFIMWALGIPKADRYTDNEQYLKRLNKIELTTGQKPNAQTVANSIGHQLVVTLDENNPESSTSILAMCIDSTKVPDDKEKRNKLFFQILDSFFKSKSKVPFSQIEWKLKELGFTEEQIKHLSESWEG